MKKVFTLCWLITSLMSVTTDAQVLLFNETRQLTFNYRFNSYQGSPEITQKIITQLSEGSGKPLFSTEYILPCDQNLELVNLNNYLQVNVSYRFLQPAGDVNYKSFYMGDLLLPSSISLLLNLYDDRNFLVRSFTISNLGPLNSYSTSVSTPVMPVPGVKFRLQAVNVMLIYSGQTLQDFQHRVNLINDYYMSNALLDNAQVQLASITSVTPDNVDATLVRIQQIEGDLWRLEQKNYNNLLNLTMYDPIRLLPRIAGLRDQLASKRLFLNQAYASLDAYNYNKGMEVIASNVPLAKTYFEKSLAVNPGFAPSAYMLAKIMFESGDALGADFKMREVWFRMNPDPTTYQNGLTLFRNIYSDYLEDADKLKDQDKYNEALTLYDRASKLCTEINGLACNTAMNVGASACRRGIYGQMVDESVQLARSGKVADARNKLAQAQKYAYENSADISERDKEDEAKSAISLSDYKNTIDEARSNFDKKMYAEALMKFEAAHDLEQRYKFSPTLIPLDMEQKAAQKVILSRIDDVQEKISKEQWDDAARILNKIGEDQSFYKLDQDNEINSKAADKRQKIQERKCQLEKRTADELMAKAQTALSEKNFLSASEYFDRVLETGNNNPECKIATTEAASGKDKILPAATYQKLINKIISDQANGDFQGAVTKYTEALSYYSQFNLSEYGLTRKELSQFVKDNFRVAGVEYTARYFKEKNEPDKALDLYKTAVTRGSQLRYVKDDLYDLGVMFAKRDKTAGEQNPKLKVAEYVPDDKDFKSFRKGYLSIFGIK